MITVFTCNPLIFGFGINNVEKTNIYVGLQNCVLLAFKQLGTASGTLLILNVLPCKELTAT